MEGKMYLSLLILCGFLCQGIVPVFSGIVDESNTLVRKKRVVNENPGEDIALKRGEVPYVASIKEIPGNFKICVGTILSAHTVITSAKCVLYHNASNLAMQTGSSYSYRGTQYNVVEKKIRASEHPINNIRDGIALLIVEPAITFNKFVAPIGLHNGILMAGTPATISGWGCNFGNGRGTNYQQKLRSITVPIMQHRECVNIYRNRAVISDKYICTFDEMKRCGHTDAGAPLVVDNHLAAIYIWSGSNQGHINPDVFLIVQDLEFSQWIRNNSVHNI